MRLLVLSVFFLLGLLGCSTYQTSISQKPCQSLCADRFKKCKRSCTNSCSKCQQRTRYEAWQSFNNYVQEKKVTGGYMVRSLNSYRDPLQCHKVSCDCVADLNTCSQGCTGLIKKQLSNVSRCA